LPQAPRFLNGYTDPEQRGLVLGLGLGEQRGGTTARYLRVGSRSTRVAGIVDVAQIQFRPSGSTTNREEIYKIKEMMVSFVDLTNRGKELGIAEQRRDLHSIRSTRATGV
jgi:hypothetical protein